MWSDFDPLVLVGAVLWIAYISSRIEKRLTEVCAKLDEIEATLQTLER